MPLVDAATLRKKLDQVRQGGHAALGLSEGASEDAVRQAYLDACKRYHPNRFARDPDPACKAIAQEIFIEVKRAYETLGGASKRPSPVAAPARPLKPGTLPPGTVPEPRAPAGQGAAPTRAGTPPVTTPLRPLTTPPAPTTRQTTTPPAPAPRQVTAPATPPRPVTPAAPAGLPRAPTPAPGVAAPRSGPSAFELTRGRELRYQAALADSAAGRHGDARKALSTLATESQDKRFRVQLFVVWGHELKAEGKLDLAQGHYENALALDAACDDARRALAGLAAARAGRR